MLQPQQVNDVAVRYTGEIAELREFLALTGMPLGTAQTLGGMVARLQNDRGFHRDLMSNIWVVIDRCNRQINYSDLLGVLAVAAAGPRLAAAADEEDAHELLRFIMESRRALDTPSESRSVAAAPRASEEAAAAPFLAPVQRPYSEATPAVPFPTTAAPKTAAAPVPPAPQSAPSTPVAETRSADPILRSAPTPPRWRAPEDQPNTAEESEKRQNRLAWIAAAACVLLALCAGIWFYSRPAKSTENTTASAPAAPQPAATTAVAPPVETNPDTASGASVLVPQPARPPAEVRGAREVPYRGIEESPRTPLNTHAAAGATYPAPTPPPTYAPAPVFREPAATVPVAPSPVPVATPSHLPVTSAAGGIAALNLRNPTTAKAPPPPVSANILSKQLDSPTAPTDYASLGIDANGRKIPRLYRRQPNGTITEVTPPSESGNATPYNGPPGIVRPTALGMSAAYVDYSPAPAYPNAALAAHVQGPVKLQAEVDKNGNVASAYVISGPPMLRDAALEAVLHWRYKPYRMGGKPSTMTATAVVEFELP